MGDICSQGNNINRRTYFSDDAILGVWGVKGWECL